MQSTLPTLASVSEDPLAFEVFMTLRTHYIGNPTFSGRSDRKF